MRPGGGVEGGMVSLVIHPWGELARGVSSVCEFDTREDECLDEVWEGKERYHGGDVFAKSVFVDVVVVGKRDGDLGW